MLKRIITSLVAVCVLIPVLIFSDTPVFPAAIALVSIICIYEILKCMGRHKSIVLSLPVYLSAVVLPFALTYFQDTYALVTVIFVASVAYLLMVFAFVIWSHGKLTFSDGMAQYAASVYILASLNSIVYIRGIEDFGKYIYILIFLGAWITDIFAYFTGVFFGKHKLIEDVSPKKTVEGSIGGILFCSLSFVLFGIVVELLFDRNANLVFLAISGVILSVISQIGDLIMSVIKRHYGIKDYGKIFPGHGGMLDRFDSVLAVSLGLAIICMFAGVAGINLLL